MANGKNSSNGVLTPSEEQNAVRRANKAKKRSQSHTRPGGLTTSQQKTQPSRWDKPLYGAVAPSVITSVKAKNGSVRNDRAHSHDVPAPRRASSSGETARLAQQAKAYRSLNPVPESYEDKVILQFMDQWLKATPVKVDGVCVQGRTSLAMKAVRDGLPKIEATSKQVNDLLGSAAAAIRMAAQ